MEVTGSEIVRQNGRANPTDAEQYVGNWIWRALECLVESPTFNPSPKWIAQRLDITVEQAVDALEGIERLGLVQRSGNSYISTKNLPQITSNIVPIDKLLAQHSKVAPQILSKLTTSDQFTTQFILADESLIQDYINKLGVLYAELISKGRQAGATEVFASEFSFVKLGKKDAQEGVQ